MVIKIFQKKFQNTLDVVENYVQDLYNNKSNNLIQSFSNFKHLKKYSIIIGILNGILYGGLFALVFVGIGTLFTFINKFITNGEMGRGDQFRVIISTILGTLRLFNTKSFIENINKSREIGAKLYSMIDHQSIDKSYLDDIKNENNSTIEPELELLSHQNVPIKRYISYNKTYLWSILIGIIGSIVNGGILPCISLIITSVFGASDDTSSILKYFSFIGGVNFLAYCLQFIGYSLAGENLSCKLRNLLYNSIINRKDDSRDIINKEKTVSFISIFKKAGLAQGITKNFGFIFEALTALIVGLTIDFLNKWTVALVILGIIILVIIIVVLKNRHSNINPETTIPSNNIKTLCIDAIINAIKNSLPYLMIALLVFLCFTAVRTEFMEFPNVIKMLIATVLTFTSIARAKMNTPNMAEAKEAFNNVIHFIDNNKINSSVPIEIKVENFNE